MFPKYEKMPTRLRRKVDALLEDYGTTREELAALIYAEHLGDRIRSLLAGLTMREGMLVALNFNEMEVALMAMVLQRSILYNRMIGERVEIHPPK